MIKRFSLGVLSILCVGSSIALAQNSTSDEQTSAAAASPAVVTDPANVDIGPAVDYFRQFVKPVSAKGYVLYHWFSGTRRDPIWKTNFPSNSPAGMDHLKNLSTLYWDAFCSSDDSINPIECQRRDKDRMSYSSSSIHGPGLYLSTDPIATASYGQDPNWVLEQVTLPRGFKYLDFSDMAAESNSSMPAEVQAVLTQLQCDTATGSSVANLRLSTIFKMGSFFGFLGSSGTDANKNICRLGMRQIFRDHLRVGGFFYSYMATTLPKCDHHQSAFVLIDSSQVPASNVRVYNSQSRDDQAIRARIHSMFYFAGTSNSGNFKPADRAQYFAYYQNPGTVPAQPNYVMTATSYFDGKCYGRFCYVTATVIDPKNPNTQTMVNLSPPPGYNFDQDSTPPAPIVMSKSNLPSTILYNSYVFGSNSLIWPDLEGTNVDPKIDSWVQQNIHGCP